MTDIYWKVRLKLLKKTQYFFLKYVFKKYGKNSVVHSLKLIFGKKFISIGKNVEIWPNSRIEPIQKYNNNFYAPAIKIGDNVSIQQNFHCTCADEIEIGDNTTITANVGIFDIIHPYSDVRISPREQDLRVAKIKIGKNCFIGMNSCILPGTKLGNHCIVGTNSTVKGLFPDYSVIAGNPAKILKKYSNEDKKWLKIY